MRRAPERKATNVEIALSRVGQVKLQPDEGLGTEVSLMHDPVEARESGNIIGLSESGGANEQTSDDKQPAHPGNRAVHMN